MPIQTALESRSFKEEKGLTGMRNRKGPEALAFQDLRCDIDRAFVRIEGEIDSFSAGSFLSPSATNPAGPSVGGDLYWNTVLGRFLFYDSSRSKWLTVEVESLPWGRRNNTAPGSYFRTIDGTTFTATRGYLAQLNGTIVGITYTRDNIDAATFEITADGVAVGEVATAATAGFDESLDIDITSSQVLGIRNKSGGNNITSAIGKLVVRWRL